MLAVGGEKIFRPFASVEERKGRFGRRGSALGDSVGLSVRRGIDSRGTKLGRLLSGVGT